MADKKVRIVVIGGVRPQYIKIAALQRSIMQYNLVSQNHIAATYIDSGQHYDELLSAQLIDDLGIQFDYRLTYPTKDPIEIMAEMFVRISRILDQLDDKPDWVVVMGDTTTTFVGATVAVRKGFPLIHLEAGVRSGDISTVEEMHRRVVSHLSTVHFCTTKASIDNLARENIIDHVYWTGDLAHDFTISCAETAGSGVIDLDKDYILTTLHKPININSEHVLSNILHVLFEYPRDTVIICHPRTRKKLDEMGIKTSLGRIHIVDALPYRKMLAAIKGCAFLLTDSGGLQREAYYLKKRCLIRRDSLGWSLFVDNDIHHLVGDNQNSLREGLAWAEYAQNTFFPSIDDQFIRSDSWLFALGTLVELSATK